MTTANLSSLSPSAHDTPRTARPANASSKQTRLMLTAYALGILFIGLFASGILLWLVIGSGPGADKYFMGWHRHTWGDLHAVLGILFSAIVVFHLLLHWGWLKIVTPRQLSAGGWLRGTGRFAALTVLLGLVSAALFFGLRGDEATAGEGRGEGRARIEQSGEGSHEGQGGMRMRRGWAGSEQTAPASHTE